MEVENVQNKMQKITTNLWFDNEAEEAAKFYTFICFWQLIDVCFGSMLLILLDYYSK